MTVLRDDLVMSPKTKFISSANCQFTPEIVLSDVIFERKITEVNRRRDNFCLRAGLSPYYFETKILKLNINLL